MDELTRKTLQYELNEKEKELDDIPLSQFTLNPQIPILISQIEELRKKLKED